MQSGHINVFTYLNRPCGAEVMYIGATDSIKWKTEHFTGNVRIQLNRSYPGEMWETILDSIPNTGFVNWTVTGPTSTTARMRIIAIGDTSQNETGKANFTITNPTTLSFNPTSVAGNAVYGGTEFHYPANNQYR